MSTNKEVLIKRLQEKFAREQNQLSITLRMSKNIEHKGDRGEANERHFIDFLRAYLPNRYTIDKAMVIDSTGAFSDSIDIVIFDRQYTPTLMDIGKHRYVPAEAVYAVFECKSSINKKNLEYAADKAASVRRLKRTSVEIHHAGGVFPAKPPRHIIEGIFALKVSWAKGLGNCFKRNHNDLTGDRVLDCGFAASGACFDVFNKAGNYQFGPEKNALAFFAFRLLSKLQTIATVPAVDWMAYANSLSNPNQNLKS